MCDDPTAEFYRSTLGHDEQKSVIFVHNFSAIFCLLKVISKIKNWLYIHILITAAVTVFTLLIRLKLP